MSCKYKDALGKPREGTHEARLPILDVASNDVMATIVGGVLIAGILGYNVFNTILVLFIISILLHRFFCVRTTVDKFLFYDTNPI